jgi:hypothetical protein
METMFEISSSLKIIPLLIFKGQYSSSVFGFYYGGPWFEQQAEPGMLNLQH